MARRRMGRKLLRADKKKAKSMDGATRRCRLKKKCEKGESQAIKASDEPSLSMTTSCVL